MPSKPLHPAGVACCEQPRLSSRSLRFRSMIGDGYHRQLVTSGEQSKIDDCKFTVEEGRRLGVGPQSAVVNRESTILEGGGQTPAAEITRAEQLRKLWMKYRNRYVGSQKEREAILKELGQ